MKIRFLLTLPILAWISACDRSAGTNDETTTSVARIYQPDGKPAAGARALLYPSGDTTQIPSGQAFVATDGSVTLPAVTKGWYNVVITDQNGRAVLIDSILSTGGSPALPSDTLRNTATVVGQILVQPQHSPQIAWVQLPGVGVYANLDTVGRFRLNGIPAGQLTLAALTREEKYTNAFVSFRTVPDSTIDLGTIDLPFTGLPVVQAIRTRYDSLEGVLHVSWNRVRAHGVQGYVVDGLPNTSFTTDTALTIRYFSPYDSGSLSNGWFDTTTKKVSFTVRVQDSTDALGPKWEKPNLTLRSMYTAQRGRWTWTALSKLPGLLNDRTRLDTVANHLVKWSPGDSASSWNLWTSADGLTWTQLWTNQRIVGSPAVSNGSVWYLKGLKPSTDSTTFAELALIRQNLDGGAVSIDTLTPSIPVPSGFLSFRHDTVIVSPAAFSGSTSTPCNDNYFFSGYAPATVESWSGSPDGHFTKMNQRAFSIEPAKHAKAAIRDLSDGFDWWIHALSSESDSCGYQTTPTAPQGGKSISLVTPVGDSLTLQSPNEYGSFNGVWAYNESSNLFQDGLVMPHSTGLVRWRFDDPSHPWVTPYPSTKEANSNTTAPWKNGIATASQDGQLWFATLSDEK
jgi:hypothetical protein